MSDESLIGQLADDFIREIQQGRLPDIEEYASKHPELADRIRELFPTLLLLEGMASPGESEHVSPFNQSGFSSGSMFGQYRIEREIGRGGMGIVYEAIHVQLERRVALKVMPVRPTMDANHLERFFREARTAAGLHHTNIVPVFDVGQVSGIPYFAMQYIEGRSLDAISHIMQSAIEEDTAVIDSSDSTLDMDAETHSSSELEVSSKNRENITSRFLNDASIRKKAGLPEKVEEYFRWVAETGIQVANGLAHAHERKVIHRDIKPSNLIIDNKGVVWIADFGLARRIEDPSVTHSGTLLGTPRYMSPEQAEAARHPVDQRSDIYSLGATLYELLTCRPVFEGKTPHDVISQIIEREPVAPKRLSREIPADLSTIIMKAMAKRPEDRYQSASLLAEDLNSWLRMEPITARRIGPVGRIVRWCRRNPRLAAVTAVAAAIVLALSGIYYTSLVRENENTREALEREKAAAHQRLLALREAEEQKEIADKERKRTEASKLEADSARDQAEEARRIAESEQKRAVKERSIAQTQKKAAELERKEALYQSYRSNILAADLSYQAKELEAAKERLSSCDPALRGWEWHYLRGIVDMSLGEGSLSGHDLFLPGGAGRDVFEVAFDDDNKTIIIKARKVLTAPARTELTVLRYLPDSDSSLIQLESGTRVVAISPNGAYALSSDWNLMDINIKCTVDGVTNSSTALCHPVSYSEIPKKLTPEDRDRLIVTETKSGRIIATLNNPNTAIWKGSSTSVRSFLEREVPARDFRSSMALSGHYPNALNAAFSKDGSLCATWSWDNVIYVWDLKKQRMLGSFREHESSVRSLSFSPDRIHAVSSSSDGTVRVWRIDNGEQIKGFHVPNPGAVTYSPDASRVAVGSNPDNTVLVYALQGDNNTPLPLKGIKGPIYSIAFSPDSKRLVAAGISDREIPLWDINSGILIKSFAGHTDYVSSVAFSPDGSRIVSGARDGTVRVWNAKNRMEVLKGHSGPVIALELLEGVSRVLSASMDGTLRVWDTRDTNSVQVLRFGKLRPGMIPSQDPDSIYMLFSGAVSTNANSVYMSLPSAVSSKANSLGMLFPGAVSINPTKSLVAISSRAQESPNNSASPGSQVIDIESFKLLAETNNLDSIDIELAHKIFTENHPNNKNAIQIGLSPDGTRLAVFSKKVDNCTLRLWEMTSRKLLAEWLIEKNIPNNGPIAFSPDGALVAVAVQAITNYGSDPFKSSILIFDVDKPEFRTTIPAPEDRNSKLPVFIPGKDHVAFQSGDTVRILNFLTLEDVAVLKGHRDGIMAISVSPDGSRMVTGGIDHTIRIWDTEHYELMLTIRIPEEAGMPYVLAFSDDSRTIAAGMYDGTIRLWYSDYPGE